jgi:hypothetical protein
MVGRRSRRVPQADAAVWRLTVRDHGRPVPGRRGWAGPGPWAGVARGPSELPVRAGPVAVVPPTGAARVGWVAERMGRWVGWGGPAGRDGRRNWGAPGGAAGWKPGTGRGRVPARRGSPEAPRRRPPGLRRAVGARQRVPRRLGARGARGRRRPVALAAQGRRRPVALAARGRRAARLRAVPAEVWGVERIGNEAGAWGVDGCPRGWIGSGRRGLARPEGRVVAEGGPRVRVGVVRRPGPTLIGRRRGPRLPGSRARVGGRRGGR